MTGTSHPVAVGRPAQPRLWGRLDTLLYVLAAMVLAVEPLLGEAGARVPLLAALHALNGLAICAMTTWLLSETRRRRAAASRSPE